MVPGWKPDQIASLHFPKRHRDGQNGILKEKFIGNQFKHRCFHYSTAVTLCDQHLIHNNKKKTGLMPG